MKHHVSDHIKDGGFRVQGGVIKEAKGTKVRAFDCLGLVVSQRAEGDEHCWVDCNGILEHRSDDLLERVYRFGGKLGRRVVYFGVLDAGTKYRAVPGMRGIFGAGKRKVLKFVQGFQNLGRHGGITVMASLIPGEGEYAEEVVVPIY